MAVGIVLGVGRRLLALCGLAVAAHLIIENLPAYNVDFRRAALVCLLAGLGVFLNLSGAVLPQFPLRAVFRGLGCVLLLCVAGGFAAAAAALRGEGPAGDAKPDPADVAQFSALVSRLAWLALACLYVAVSLLLLPPSARAPAQAAANAVGRD